MTQRDVSEAWVAAFEAAGLPLSIGAGGKARVTFGAPLPVGLVAERELIDVVLTERWPRWRVREAIEAVAPPGWRLVDLGDAWLAGPPLAGEIVGADYRIALGEASTSLAALARAARSMVESVTIRRERTKGDDRIGYDLRPLLVDLAVVDGAAPSSFVLRARVRFDPALGNGRPEEVVAELGDRLGVALRIDSMVRERLLTSADDGRLDEGAASRGR